MKKNEFEYQYTEISCSDLKIIFITDETTTVATDSGVHMHSFWELFVLHKGSLKVTSDNNTYTLSEGQSLLIPPNAYHSTRFENNSIKSSIFFTFEKTKTKEPELLFDEIHKTFSQKSFHLFTDPYIGHLLGMFFTNNETKKIGKSWRLKANISELIFYLYDSIKGDIPPQNSISIKHDTYWLYKYAIERLLDENYMNDISLEELSNKLSLSPQNITRIISSAYGKTFNTLKVELKIRNAKLLLRETDLSVHEIGEKIGYSSSRGFFSAFSKYEKCTPSQYRKKHRN